MIYSTVNIKQCKSKIKRTKLIVKGVSREFFIWHYKKHKDIHIDINYKNDTGLKHRRPCGQRKEFALFAQTVPLLRKACGGQ